MSETFCKNIDLGLYPSTNISSISYQNCIWCFLKTVYHCKFEMWAFLNTVSMSLRKAANQACRNCSDGMDTNNWNPSSSYRRWTVFMWHDKQLDYFITFYTVQKLSRIFLRLCNPFKYLKQKLQRPIGMLFYGVHGIIFEVWGRLSFDICEGQRLYAADQFPKFSIYS